MLEPRNNFPVWESGSFQLVSLLSMLEKHADDYVQMGKLVQYIIDYAAAIIMPDVQLTDDEMKMINGQLFIMATHAATLEMDVSVNMIHETFNNYKIVTPTWRQVGSELEYLARTIIAELKSRTLFYIWSHRLPYYKGENLLTKETLESFPSVNWDMEEAGKCFATERFTAAVHHLMQVAEYGLISFAEFCEIPEKQRSNWNTALNQIDKGMREKTIPNLLNMTKDDEQYYTEVASWLRNVKTAWRNPVSHIPIIYDEAKALELFGAVKSLMHHLSKRFKEVPKVVLP
ncbi:MAG: hypothetical protein WBW55_07655 [Desulfobaccales bacterium]